MYKITLFSKSEYWITEEEAQEVVKQLNSKEFIILRRLKKVFNRRDVRSVECPDFLKDIPEKNIRFGLDGAPFLLNSKNECFVWEGGEWVYTNEKQTGLTFQQMIEAQTFIRNKQIENGK